MRIRPEDQSEFDQIYHLVQTAFATAKVSDGDEQNFVCQLRNSPGYLPQLALVAEEDGVLIGHIMHTKLTLHTQQGEDVKALLLAPLSVALEHRNKGVGGKLIAESFAIARELGYTLSFLCGDPAYYQRFGYRSCDAYHITNVNDIPAPFSMVCELVPGALGQSAGQIDFFESTKEK